MKSNLKPDLKFRKLKLTDYIEFKNLFYSCFKKISFNFFKWRYFDDKSSFCYGAFHSTKLIANVGMISLDLYKKPNRRIFSRHSSMVSKNFRGKGVFSDLTRRVKKFFQKS